MLRHDYRSSVSQTAIDFDLFPAIPLTHEGRGDPISNQAARRERSRCPARADSSDTLTAGRLAAAALLAFFSSRSSSKADMDVRKYRARVGSLVIVSRLGSATSGPRWIFCRAPYEQLRVACDLKIADRTRHRPGLAERLSCKSKRGRYNY